MDWLDFVFIGLAALSLVIGIYQMSTKKCITKIINKKYSKESVKKYIPLESVCYILVSFGLVGIAVGNLPELVAGNWVTGGYAAIIAALVLDILFIHKVLKSK